MILARYVLREHIAPFFYALFVITFLFLVDFLIHILSSILSKGLSWRVVLEIIVLNMAWMVALSVPMAVLVATLMAFGRFAADNEITAMKSLGISPFKAMAPILVMAATLGVGLIYFNNNILPNANYRAAALRNDIGRKKPSALITPRTLIKDFENYQIWIDRLDPVSGLMTGVKIYNIDPGKPIRYTFADTASMEYANGEKNIVVHLRHGENHFLDPKDANNYVRVRFRSQDVAIDNVDASLERRERGYRTDREMTIQDMYKVVKEGRSRIKSLHGEFQQSVFDEMRALDLLIAADTGHSVPPRLLQKKWWKEKPIPPLAYINVTRREKDKLVQVERYERRVENEQQEVSQYLVEIHKKFSIPVACLVFVFIGAPLGIMARRGGIGTGSIYSMAFFLFYWVCLLRGEVLADRLLLNPWVAMWSPNILVGLAGLFLVARMSRENYLNAPTWPQNLFRFLRIRRDPKQPGESAAGGPQ